MLKAFFSAVVLFLALALPSSAAFAATDPNPFRNREPGFSKKVELLLSDAEKAWGRNDKGEAIRLLNLASSLEPKNPYVTARLAVALNKVGGYQDALDRLRWARRLGAPDNVVLGPMLEAMLNLGQNQIVLDLYPDPGSRTDFVAGMILRARASALQVMGNSAGASDAMKRSLAILNDYDGVMTAARISFMQGDYSAADGRADAALKLRPNDIEARMLKVQLQFSQHNIALARQMADKLVADNPNSLSAILMRIKVYLMSNRPDVIEPDVDRILGEAPDMMMVRYFKAVIVAGRGNAKAAWDIAHILPKEFIQIDAGVALNVASIAIQAGFIDTGAAILGVAVQRFPYYVEPRLQLADLRLRQKSPEYALNALTILKDSKDPRVLVLFARALLLKKDSAGAQKYIRQVIEAGGGEELRTMDKDVALKSLSDYSAAHPDNQLVKKQYAILLLGFGEMEKAKAAYEKLVSDNPSDGVSLNNLSWLVVKNDPGRAVVLAQRAVKGDPSSANNLDTLGSMQMGRSDFKGAVASLQKAHDLAPDDAEISYHFALALEGSGQGAQAQMLLRALVKRGGFSELDAAKNLLASKLKLAGQTQVER
jgi:tetratricopeptide (TPR) repeat protein